MPQMACLRPAVRMQLAHKEQLAQAQTNLFLFFTLFHSHNWMVCDPLVGQQFPDTTLRTSLVFMERAPKTDPS